MSKSKEIAEIRTVASPLRVIVVDDEAPARALLVEYLGDDPRVEVVGACANGFEAVKTVAEMTPDLVLLDVQMPKLDGFEVLELLDDPKPAVIFVTAYDQYAIDAFGVHAADYLLKPAEPERLREGIDRVIAARDTDAAPSIDAETLRNAARPESFLDRILIRDGSRIHVLQAEDLDYIEAQSDYALFVSGGTRHRKQQTLADLEKRLDPSRFVRVHRSYILNVERLARIELYAKDSRVAILRDRTRVPISRAGYARLRDLL